LPPMEQSLIEETYGGVPLGAEAAVVVPQYAMEAERNRNEDRPAPVTLSASDAWRG
jgi:hypothetical protein